MFNHCYLAYFEGDYSVLECQKYNACAGMLQMYPWRMKRMCCLLAMWKMVF
jgi:hypothetical protein